MDTEESDTNDLTTSTKPYDRYCRQLDKEDTLIDQRLNWMIASESILFAALGLSNNHFSGVMSIVVPLVGVCVSIFIGISVRAAVSSYRNYRVKLLKLYPQSNDKEFLFPQLHRDDAIINNGFKSALVLPWVFLVAWTVIFLWALAN